MNDGEYIPLGGNERRSLLQAARLFEATSPGPVSAVTGKPIERVA